MSAMSGIQGLWIAAGLAACSGGGAPGPERGAEVLVDADGDGVSPSGGDCDDGDATVGASVEICDGKDQDCDGLVDEGASDATIVFVDGDGDGYGALGSEHVACAGPGLVTAGGDCDDTTGARRPDADELCNGVDDDCDPTTTEGATVAGVPYATVAGAVAAASDGDVISVCPGVHEVAAVLVTTELVVRGATDDPADTVLDGGGRDRVFQVDGGALTLERLTVRNGNAPIGGAVSAVSGEGGPVTAASCVFEGNAADDGGALAVGEATLTDVRFIGNAALDRGGAVYHTRGPLVVVGSTFEANGADAGGAIASGAFDLGGTRLVTIEATTFTGNTGASGAGAVELWDATATLTARTVEGNIGEHGGGLKAFDADVALPDTVVSDNVAVLGGGITLNGDSSLTGGTFTGNRAELYGGAIDVSPGAPIRVDGVDVIGNQAAYSGGGIHLFAGELVLTASVVAENAAPVGGGILEQGGTLTATDVEFRANTADRGGGLELASPASLVGGSLIENVAAVGAGASFDVRVSFDGTDLGADATDNVGDDLASNGAALHGLGAGTQATCRFVAATDTIVCEPPAQNRQR